MNLLNFNIIKKILGTSLKKGYVRWIPYFYHYLPTNWTDSNGNNLYHFSAIHQSEYLFELAQYNKANINQPNNIGKAPIHKFIESCFILKDGAQKIDEKYLLDNNKNLPITFDFNKKLLLQFIEQKADINQWIKDPERQGQWGKNVATNSRNNIMGSPIELLILLFWREVATIHFNDKDTYLLYEDMYSILSRAGAKINLIVESGTFFNLDNETLIDAMQMTSSVIVCHFFVKYLTLDNDLYAIKPFFKDPNLDFSLCDDQQNTILHHFFSKCKSRFDRLSIDEINNIIISILENPSFKKEDLYIKNTFRITPINCLNGKADIYKQLIEKLLLKQKLDASLKAETLIKPSVRKI